MLPVRAKIYIHLSLQELKHTESCPTFCDPMDCSPPVSSIHGISQVRILEWVYRFLLHGIFLTQGWNLCLLRWQADSLPLSHQGKPQSVDVIF